MQLGRLKLSFEKQPSFDKVDEKPSADLFREVSRSDSSLYEKYDYRPYNPDQLYNKHGNYDLYDEARQDDQISAVLALKKMLILDSEWQIVVDGGSEELQEEISEYLTNNLKSGLPEIFEKKLYDFLTSYDYGFSMTERIFGMDGNRIYLKDLKTRAPHGFRFEQDKYGNITKIIQDNGSGEDEIAADKFIHYINNGEFQNPYGQSEINMGIYTAWWSKNAIRKFWNMYLERFGMPTTVGKYPQSMVQHKDVLKKVLKNIQAKTSIVIPDEVEIELLEKAGGKGGQTDFEAAISHYNMTIARKMLVPDLVGFGGSEISGGSYALGKEHFGIFYTVIEQERRRLEATVNKYIIKPLVFWNWGSSVTADFNFHLVDEHRKEKDLTLWLEAVKTGKIPVTDTHINWFLNQVDSPEIDKDELEQIKAEKEEMALAIQGGNGAEDNDKQMGNDKGNNPPEPVKPDTKDDGKDNPKDEKKPSQKKFVKKEKTNFKVIEKQTDGLQEKYVPLLAANFKVAINGLLDDIKRRKIIEGKKFEAINKLKLRNMMPVKNTLKAMYRESYTDGSASVPVRKDFAVNDITDLGAEDVVAMFEEKAFWITGVEEAEILDAVRGVLINGIESGSGVSEIESMIMDILKPWGIKTLDPYRIETIVRTNVFDAYNQARNQQFQEMSDFIVGYKYNAILDGRTSAVCKKLDSELTGKIYTPDEAQGITPPNHFNCRSLLEPVFEDEIEDETKAGMEIGKVDKSLKKNKGGFLEVAK